MSDAVVIAILATIVAPMGAYIVKQWTEITELKIKLAAYDSAAPDLIREVRELIETERRGAPVAASIRRPRAPRETRRKRSQT